MESSAHPSLSVAKSRVKRVFDSQSTSYGEGFPTHFDMLLFELESREIVAALRRLKGTVLDMGIGRGRYAKLLFSGNPSVDRVVGVDLSRSMLAAARSDVTLGLLHVAVADGATLPFKPQSIDGVIAVRSV